MLLEEARDYFAALNPSVGPMSLGSLPNEPHAIIALREYSAGSPDLGFGAPRGVKFEYAGLQILVRGEPQDYDTPRTLIERLYLAGALVQAKTLGTPGTRHLIWLPQQSPFVLERDPRNRWVMAVNFIVQKDPSP